MHPLARRRLGPRTLPWLQADAGCSELRLWGGSGGSGSLRFRWDRAIIPIAALTPSLLQPGAARRLRRQGAHSHARHGLARPNPSSSPNPNPNPNSNPTPSPINPNPNFNPNPNQVSPGSSAAEHTLDTLRYAARVRDFSARRASSPVAVLPPLPPPPMPPLPPPPARAPRAAAQHAMEGTKVFGTPHAPKLAMAADARGGTASAAGACTGAGAASPGGLGETKVHW